MTVYINGGVSLKLKGHIALGLSVRPSSRPLKKIKI